MLFEYSNNFSLIFQDDSDDMLQPFGDQDGDSTDSEGEVGDSSDEEQDVNKF